MTRELHTSWLSRLRERGVLRVAASYAVIAWLVLQIASVVFDPLGVPKWVMPALIAIAAVGLPVAIALAWFLRRDAGAVEASESAAGSTRPAAHGLRHYADAIVIGVLLVTVAILAVKQSDFAKPKRPDNPAIAVLPFENLSGDPSQEYFSDGLAEETLDRLGRVPGLRVIARSSSFRFKGKDLDIKAIAETLGVTTILEGSVRRAGRHLKVSARLIDGATGQETWSGSFDREMTDVFKVQEELARSVVDAILPAAKGGQVRLDPVPSADLSAYDLYLLAKQSQWQRTPDALKRAVTLLERSIALDPNYASAHAQLALSLSIANAYSDIDQTQIRERWRAETHRALALDPDQPTAQLMRALDTAWQSGNKNPETLLADVKRVVDRNPNYAQALHDYSRLLSVDHPADALKWFDRALKVDPLAVSPRANMIITLQGLGYVRRRDEALAEFARLFDGDADAQYMLARLSMRVLDDPVRAATAARRAIALLPPNPTPQATVILHRALLAVGAYAEAERLLAGTDWEMRDPALLAYEQALASGSAADRDGLGRAIAALHKLPSDPVRDGALMLWLALAGQCPETKALGESALAAHPIRLYTLTGLAEEPVDLARLWCLIATGQSEKAQSDLHDWLQDARAHAARSPHDVVNHTSLAALESMSRNDSAAIAALGTAFRLSPLPRDFMPQLPWFARLAGRPDYDRLIATWTAARTSARVHLLAAGGTANAGPAIAKSERAAAGS